LPAAIPVYANAISVADCHDNEETYLNDVLELNEEGVNYNVWLLDEVEINMDMCGERLTIYTS
jgi:hypothetical protein